ncbi:hypothetical protein M422DRAFT_257852 [Sphaerobolus stellatus SS14]|uniref:Secreted protein n=1 Tax=Sphaerobolus stellatus (strain SS14) TaxID=990650 RepID=A0A0C9VMQ8_SPHS4|nr:hypothetical protein M422DRAFT_265285 [Sphaerobolus stellatus SS14]KIJ39245.1 hypothetical protein M422DRAFT_257852 [Sphaerobolus stellatus SS14]
MNFIFRTLTLLIYLRFATAGWVLNFYKNGNCSGTATLNATGDSTTSCTQNSAATVGGLTSSVVGGCTYYFFSDATCANLVGDLVSVNSCLSNSKSMIAAFNVTCVKAPTSSTSAPVSTISSSASTNLVKTVGF